MSLSDGDFGYHDLERVALGFVLEDETWPVFLEWARKYAVSDQVNTWLSAPDLEEARHLWAMHSPDPRVREVLENSGAAVQRVSGPREHIPTPE